MRAFAARDPTFKADLAAAMARAATAHAASIEAELDAAIAAVARGVRPRRLKAHGLMDVSRLNHYRRHRPGIEARVRAALAAAGHGPKAPFGDRVKELLAELEGGASLREACDRASISLTNLKQKRAADPKLDRAICDRLAPAKHFDAAVKAALVKSIANGDMMKAALAKVGFAPITFHFHLKSDANFAQAVHDALGGYDDISKGVRPTKAKAAFAKVLALIPVTDTVTEACRLAGTSGMQFWSLVHNCPRRRAAYESVVGALDHSMRGRHNPAHSALTQVDPVIRLLRGGSTLAEACRSVGVSHSTINKWRRRHPEIDNRIRGAGHSETRTGRNLLDMTARREAVLDKLRSGTPIYGLGRVGLPGEATVRIFARGNRSFAGDLAEALRAGADKRRLYPAELREEALRAIARGVTEKSLPDIGLPGDFMLRYYRRKDPDFERRYQAAKRCAAGDVSGSAPLSPDELVSLVGRRLPRGLAPDERQDCLNQAWIDAISGTLSAENASKMAKGYAVENRSGSWGRVHVDQNGDVRSNFAD